MADPRSSVAYDGIDYEAQTFLIDNSTITYSATATNGSTKVGLAVALSGNKTVETAGDGEEVLGKLISVDADGFATVQTCGFMKLPGGNGASLTPGKKIVGALNASSAEGYIREVNTATAAENGVSRGMIIDAGTTTAVVVKL